MTKRKSIAYEMTKTVVLLTLLMGGTVSSIQVFQDYHHRLATLNERVEEVINSVEKAATKAVYTFDSDLAAEIAAGLFEFDPITSVEIKDENKKTMTTLVRYMGARPYEEITKHLFDEEYHFMRPLRLQDSGQDIIGSLRVKVTPHETAQAFLHRSLYIFGATMLESFLLSVLLLFVFYKTVTRPLHRLAHDFKEIDPAKPANSSLRLAPHLANTEFEEVTNAGNKLLSIIGSHLRSKDIAETKLKAQKEETERYLTIAEAIILKLDQYGHIVMLNQRGLDLLGYDVEDIVGRDWFDIAIPPNEHPKLRKLFGDLFKPPYRAGEPDKSSYFENEVITKTGERRLLFWHNSIERDEFGNAIGVLSSGQDITERKQAEDALQASEGSLRAIIEATSEGFVIGDLDKMEITDINSSLYEMLGYKREDMFNRPITDFIYPEDLEFWLSRRDKTNHTSHQSYEVRLLAKSGEPIPVEINSTVLPKAEHENLRSVAFITNISARKLQQEKQKKLESQLRQAQKMETIGTLAGGIAHDFNNILTPILGYSSLLSSRIPEDDPNHARIQQIAKSANRAASMIKQILTFSKRTEGEMISTHLAPTLIEAMQLVQSTTPANIEIKQHIPHDCPPVVADDTQIQQLILNLCTNANQAMHPEGGVLEVILEEENITADVADLHPTLHVGPYLKITVKDEGHGMDGDTKTRIFDPFFTTKKSGEGTGLGLAMVHGIVQNHNGDIQVESEPGVGSRFTVYLPITNLPIERNESSHAMILGNHERALIVDDELINTQFIEDLLEEAGYEYQSYTDSIEALDDFVTNPDKYQIILTDQTMPKMSGDQMIRAIREINQEIPIIMMSGYDANISIENAAEIGVDYFIQKPVSIDELTTAMNALLESEGRPDKTPT
ncbi:MAG: PAS domain S-box protein [Methylocystaceae bacterium]|nr:PAS domain S-box protein [Methylocystaceae bacterium]